MVFSGIPFLYYFLPAVMIAYFGVPFRFRNGVLLLFSLIFYGWSEPKLLALMVATVLLFYFCDLYQSKRVSGRRREFMNIVKSNTVGLVGIIVVLYVINQPNYSREMFFLFWCINIVALTGYRNLLRMGLRYIRKRGHNLKYILLVGYSQSAEQYINRIRLNPEWGYVIRGILDDNIERGTSYKGIKVLGAIDNLFVILPENKLDEIAITLPLSQYGRLKEIVELCEKSGVHTQFVPDYSGIVPNRPYTEDLQGLPVINIRHVPLNLTMNAVLKRAMDIVGSIFAIVLFSPIMLASVIAIKATSKGPVIFAQERVGRHNRPYKMYKFRTMYVQNEEEEQKAWTVKDDPRVTKVGKFLRRTSLDELPQFFNILIGQMSLVGPRPERPMFVEKFKEEIPRYMVKHQVRPGLTGWAQIHGLRGDTSIEKRIEYDLYYIENWTFELDLRILFLTVFKGFINENAY